MLGVNCYNSILEKKYVQELKQGFDNEEREYSFPKLGDISNIKNNLNKLNKKSLSDIQLNNISKILERIIAEIKPNLDILLIGKLKDALRINDNIYKKYNIDKLESNEQKIINDFLRKVMDYGSEPLLPRNLTYEIYRNYDGTICPYCNIDQAVAITVDEEDIMRTEIDHFYSQSSHPLLSLNIYNFIPSCAQCNHVKSNTQFSLKDNLYPYEETLITEKVFAYIINEQGEYIIKIVNDNPKFRNNRKTFKLDERYKVTGGDTLEEAIESYNKYNANYIKSIDTNFNIDIEKIKDQLGYKKIDKINRKSMAKMKNDIIDQLLDK